MSLFSRKRAKDGKKNGNNTPQVSETIQTSSQASFKKLPTFFNNFSEKQINLIYSLTRIQKFSDKEYLFKEGESPSALVIILEGAVDVVSSRAPDPLPSGPGAFLAAKAFTTGAPYDRAAYAASQTSAMFIDKNAMVLLDEAIRESLTAEIIRQYDTRSETLETASAVNNRKVSLLAKNLFAARTAQIYDYEKSELILNIIKKIPKLPAYTHTLSSKLLDDNASSKDVVGLIRQDPALVADVLKTVNSSYYGLEQKVSDINSAVLLLGFQSLYQLIMSDGIRKTMPDTQDFRQIHAHALALSYIAFSLSMTLKAGVPVQMATIGLLHNMGESVVSLLVQRNPNLSVFINSLDRPSLGAFLLEGWNFPKNISQTVKYQSFPEFAAPDAVPGDIHVPVSLLYISQLCYRLIQKSPVQDLPLIYLDDYKRILKLGNLSLEEIAARYVIADLRKKQESLPGPLKKLIFSEAE